MVTKKPKKKRGCFSGFLGFLILLIILYFGWQWLSGLGSAKFEISSLEARLKTDREGIPRDSTILVEMTLVNRGSQPGQFVLDRDSYDEARQLENLEAGKVWTFKTELHYPGIDQWITIDNADNWGGDKITPGALEITLDENAELSLSFYIKSGRGWRVRMPEHIPAGIDNRSVADQLQVSIISPAGNITSSSKIMLQ
jgi:hypothetical protein